MQTLQTRDRPHLHRLSHPDELKKLRRSLLDRNRRISEIAYDVGLPVAHSFQPHFQETRRQIAQQLSPIGFQTRIVLIKKDNEQQRCLLAIIAVQPAMRFQAVDSALRQQWSQLTQVSLQHLLQLARS